MMHSILDYNYNPYCTEIFQPILSQNILENNPQAQSLYGFSNYKYIFGERPSLIGKIFYWDNQNIKKYPTHKTAIWRPTELNYNKDKFQRFIAYTTLKIQNSFLEKGLSLGSKISPSVLIKLRSDLRTNNLILDKLT